MQIKYQHGRNSIMFVHLENWIQDNLDHLHKEVFPPLDLPLDKLLNIPEIQNLYANDENV
jgi:hypothetical protein